LLNTIGMLVDKVEKETLMSHKHLSHKRAFAGRKGRAAIDSVMLMDEIRSRAGGQVNGMDIKSAFNGLDRDVMYRVLRAPFPSLPWCN